MNSSCETECKQLAVVFLARGGDGLAATEAFLESYRKYISGVRHSLVVLTKGWNRDAEQSTVIRWTHALQGSLIELPDDGFDFGAYFRAMPMLREEWICILNTHSRIRADNWLKLLYDAARRPGVGAAGATGSWESAWRNVRNFDRHTGVLHFARFAYNGICYPPFPNPHLRSNALLTRRRLFMEFASGKSIPQHKRDAQRLESGRRGLSSFVRSRGLELVVCGADGGVFSERQWSNSGTFRIANHPNLLVEDNQTRAFDRAPPAVRQALRDAAWGLTKTT